MPTGATEFHRIYGPLAALLAGLSTYCIADCMGGSQGTGATGASASAGICYGVLFIMMMLWIPAGIVMIACLHRPLYKKRDACNAPAGFWQPCGWVIGLLLTFCAFLSADFGLWTAAALPSFTISFIAGWVWWGIGRMATAATRRNAE